MYNKERWCGFIIDQDDLHMGVHCGGQFNVL